MKELIYLDPPVDLESMKSAVSSKIPIGGAQVSQTELFNSLLKYSSFDTYSFVHSLESGVTDELKSFRLHPVGDKIRYISAREIHKLRFSEDTVIFQATPLLHKLDCIRSAIGLRNLPIVGLLHAVSINDALLAAMYCLEARRRAELNDLSLICSSRAGKQAFLNICKQLTNDDLSKNDLLGATESFPIIPLGVDSEFYTPGDKISSRQQMGISINTTVFLYVGRLSSEFKCDIHPVILAFKAAFCSNDDVLLIIAGDVTSSNLSKSLTEFVTFNGLTDKVKFVNNPTKDLKLTLYQSADVFVSFSDNIQETFGLANIEAMSCGLPVIASDWSGYRETINAGETGFLVTTTWLETSSLPSMLSFIYDEAHTHFLFARMVSFDLHLAVKYFRLLHQNSELRLQMSINARKHVLSLFSWEKSISALTRHFEYLSKQSKLRALKSPKRCLPIGAYDHTYVFNHYATTSMCLGDVVVPSQFFQDFILGEIRIPLLDIFVQDRLRILIKSIRFPSSVLTLANQVSGLLQITEEESTLLIGILSKYGVLGFEKYSKIAI